MNTQVCPQCGVEFSKKLYRSIYCGRKCSLLRGRATRMTRANNTEAILARFMARVSPEPNSGCWLWTGTLNRGGYGELLCRGKIEIASRLSWMLFRGAIPDGLCALHTCDTRACVNPDHLYIGTIKQNAIDAFVRGGHRPPLLSGESHHFARLTPDKVREMRRQYAAREANQHELAARYGITQSSAWAVLHNKTWKGVA